MSLPEGYVGHNLDEHFWEDTGVVWCLTYPSGMAPFLGPGAKFLGSKRG